jgi:hypothetical protein
MSCCGNRFGSAFHSAKRFGIPRQEDDSMQALLDRIAFCRCFGRRRLTGFPAADMQWDEAHDTPGSEVESGPTLRPGVKSLERWIDLNA